LNAIQNCSNAFWAIGLFPSLDNCPTPAVKVKLEAKRGETLIHNGPCFRRSSLLRLVTGGVENNLLKMLRGICLGAEITNVQRLEVKMRVEAAIHIGPLSRPTTSPSKNSRILVR